MSVRLRKLNWNGVSGMPCAREGATRVVVQMKHKVESAASLDQ
jgi:hypothetical protein